VAIMSFNLLSTKLGRMPIRVHVLCLGHIEI
jgi:hypothetical protein